jgi:hypothetical protein
MSHPLGLPANLPEVNIMQVVAMFTPYRCVMRDATPWISPAWSKFRPTIAHDFDQRKRQALWCKLQSLLAMLQ